MIQLSASDGFAFKAYVATPAGKARGAIVVMQEAFGVNKHIRAVADAYAANGYLAVAPSAYDRVQADFESGYDEGEIKTAIGIMNQMTWDDAILDMKAAIEHASKAGRVGIVGYCWGGSASWVAACRIPGLAAAVSYYGGAIPEFVTEKPKCPMILHFGEKDMRPSLEQGKAIAAAHPQAQSFFYPAGHGFNCDLRGSFDQESSSLALMRTMELFKEHVG